MNEENIKVGDIVKSTQNDFGILYQVTKTLKTVCWVRTAEAEKVMQHGAVIDLFRTYKNIKYNHIQKVEKDTFFIIARLHRDDIKQALHDHDKLTSEAEERVENLSDADMELLAKKMGNDYIEQLFWDSLYILYTMLLEDEAK